MNPIEYDVVIVGGGMAGLSAGAVLTGHGLRTAVVAAGEPTACLSTGCIDFCQGSSPLKAIADLPAAHPLHLIPAENLFAAQDLFLKIMKHAGLPYLGNLETNRTILTAIGSCKTTCLVPETMRFSPQGDDASIHLVTFAGLKDFYPSYITTRRKASISTYDAAASNTMAIAALFEREDFLDTFLKWLVRQQIGEDLIAFPAVLGLESSSRIRTAIEETVGRPVFEIPTLPPSIPGRRLFNAMKNYFRAKGGDMYWNWPACGIEKTGATVEAIYTQGQGRLKTLSARAFILATGSFVGGGLTSTRKTIQEKVFNLPVHIPADHDAWFEENYFFANHAVSKAGIAIDASFRPHDAPLTNVFICGGILAHTQILKYGCGHGLSLSTGYSAAQACAEMLA